MQIFTRIYLQILLYIANRNKKEWKDIPKINPEFIHNYKRWNKYVVYINAKGGKALFIGKNVHRSTFYREDFIEVFLPNKSLFYVNGNFIGWHNGDNLEGARFCHKVEQLGIIHLRDRFSSNKDDYSEPTNSSHFLF